MSLAVLMKRSLGALHIVDQCSTKRSYTDSAQGACMVAMLMTHFRKLQLKEDEWLRQLLPSHESMLQMQQEDLAPPIGGFGKSAQRYLAFYHSLEQTQGQNRINCIGCGCDKWLTYGKKLLGSI